MTHSSRTAKSQQIRMQRLHRHPIAAVFMRPLLLNQCPP